MTDLWRNVSAHMQPLASGRPVAPGETCELNLNDPHDKALSESAFAAAQDATDYESLHVEQLQSLATAAGIDVKGTGQGGAVLKADLVKALKKETT